MQSAHIKWQFVSEANSLCAIAQLWAQREADEPPHDNKNTVERIGQTYPLCSPDGRSWRLAAAAVSPPHRVLDQPQQSKPYPDAPVRYTGQAKATIKSKFRPASVRVPPWQS